MVAGQGIFASLLGLCVAIDPRYLLERDEGGVSNYGTRPDTVAFYSAAFAGCSVLMWRAARRLPTETPGPTGGAQTGPTGAEAGPSGGAEVPNRTGGAEPSARAARRSRLGASPATRVGVQAVSVLLAAVLLSSFPYKLSSALEDLHLAVSVLLYVAELALLMWLTFAGERNLPVVSVLALALALVGAAVSVASTIGVVRLLMVGEAATAAGFGAGVVLAFHGFATAAPGS